MQNLKKPYLEAIQRILRYIKRIIDHGLFYMKGEILQMVKYCEANYAWDHDSQKSMTRYVFKFGLMAMS